MVSQITRKVCVLGDQAVGKTSVINRYVYDLFDDRYKTTIGSKVSKKRLTLASQGAELSLHIWDLLGQKSFKLHPVYYQGARGGVVICDLTRPETLASVEEWVTSFYKVVGEVPVVFFANKVDLKREQAFDKEDVVEVADRFDGEVFMTSAKTGENVEKGFGKLAVMLV